MYFAFWPSKKYMSIRNPDKYGFKLKPEHLYEEENFHVVEVKESIKSLVDFANAQGINYKLLKRYNPWLRDEKLTVKKGKSYFIAIPNSQTPQSKS